RRLHLAPRAARAIELDALSGQALAADEVADARHFLGDARVGRDDVVEGVGDLAVEADPVAGKANREVALPHRLKGAQQFGLVRRGVVETYARAGGGKPGLLFHEIRLRPNGSKEADSVPGRLRACGARVATSTAAG